MGCPIQSQVAVRVAARHHGAAAASRHARTKQSHLKFKIEALEEQIPVIEAKIAETERNLRMRQSARTVATFHLHTQVGTPPA